MKPRMSKLIFGIALLFMHSAALIGQQSQRTPSEAQTISLNLHDASLLNTLQLLVGRLGKNLMLDADIDEAQLNMTLSNIRPIDAFTAVLAAHGLTYTELEGDVYYVAPVEKISERAVIKNIACRYADAVKLRKILENMHQKKNAEIYADARTNMLIIKAPAEIIDDITALIHRLDTPTQQIYIQAEIVEISSNSDSEIGVQWLTKEFKLKDATGKVGTEFGLTTDETAGTTAESSAGVAFPVSNGFGLGILSEDIGVVMHALHYNNNVNLLSRPRIVTLDNQESVIEVGDQLPFKVLNQYGVTSFEFKNATVQLIVKPHIIDENIIRLQVSPKADFQNGYTTDGIPIISTRKATTNVKVPNGKTLVIGGLIRDSKIETTEKVPFFGSIPILGRLFKNTKKTNQKTELLVFITPTIIPDDFSQGVFEKDMEAREKLNKYFNVQE